jgi:hypothetical protein
MAMVAPHVHKYLSADALFALVRTAFSRLGDHRAGMPDIALSDALMSACAPLSVFWGAYGSMGSGLAWPYASALRGFLVRPRGCAVPGASSWHLPGHTPGARGCPGCERTGHVLGLSRCALRPYPTDQPRAAYGLCPGTGLVLPIVSRFPGKIGVGVGFSRSQASRAVPVAVLSSHR